MNGNGKDHDETRDLKQLLASRGACKDRQKDEQQRAQPTGAKPGDQETTPKVQPSPGQRYEKNDGTAENDTYRKEKNRQVQHRKPAPYQRTTEQNKGKQQRHFSGGLTIFKKTVAKLNVERGNRQAGGKGGKKSAPVNRFGRSVGCKRYP